MTANATIKGDMYNKIKDKCKNEGTRKKAKYYLKREYYLYYQSNVNYSNLCLYTNDIRVMIVTT